MRPLRILYPGALYHATARGNERRRIFRDTFDYLAFLAELDLACARYGWICHGYCLMPNHFHLLIETPRANLPIGMRHLNGCYAQYFNRRWKRVGHLFQGRYSSELIEDDEYLAEAVRYLASNPVRTTPPLAGRPEQYRWSSYRAMLGLAPCPAWLTIDWILRRFGRDYEVARMKLKEFVDEGVDHEPAQASRGPYLGGDAFARRVTAGFGPIPEVPRSHWLPVRPELEEIFQTADEPIIVAYRTYGYTLREIAEHLGCHYQTVSRRLRRAEAA